ncbi:hypothetical protein TNCV_3570551 [Trichonephila clavipes]|nr:hypothetical protein TNCV_3570551 [Trichonephila clavipes]
MELFIHPMLSLRELSLLKLAIVVFNDPDIKEYIKKHRNDSFVFPSREVVIFMDRNEGRVGQTWIRREFLVDATEIVDLNFSPEFYYSPPRNIKFVSMNERSEILPFRKWEELVEKKIKLVLITE